MPDAKLELLIRDREADGRKFTIKEIPSGLLYAGYRPTKIPPDGYETAEDVSPLDGRRYFVLKAKDSRKYLSLNEREFYLWELMDGTKSIREIASAYFFQFGSLDFTAIKNLLGRLRDAGLVDFVPASRLRVAIDRSRHPALRRLSGWLGRLEYRIDDADGWVTRLYVKGGRLLVTRYAMMFYLAFSAMGVMAFGRIDQIAKFPYHLFNEHMFLAVAAILLSFYPIAMVHEIFHALACKKYGRKVYAFGLTLWDGFYPSFYTDVSDIYLSPRKERLLVSLAGPLSTTALAAMFFIPVAIYPEARWAEAFYEMGRLNLLVGFISLYPFQFIKMDGYYLLVDMLGFPGLRERTFAFIRNLPDFVRAGKPFTRTEVIMLAYAALSLFSILAFAAYFFF